MTNHPCILNEGQSLDTTGAHGASAKETWSMPAGIAPNVSLASDVKLEEFVMLGKQAETNSTGDLDAAVTSIASQALIRSHTVIYAGVTIGRRFKSGHHVTIREHTRIGDDVSIGTGSVIEHHVVIEDSVRVHSNVFVPEFSVLQSGCWLGPNVVLTNAKYPQSPGVKDRLIGPTIMSGAKIGANATILPGVVVGANSLVGAGSVVTSDVPADAVVAGNPARVINTISVLPYDTQEGDSVTEPKRLALAELGAYNGFDGAIPGHPITIVTETTPPMSAAVIAPPIPGNDLRAQHEPIKEELEEAVARVMDSCAFIGGSFVESFAQHWAAYCSVKRAIPCSSGTEALRLALVGVLGQGDGHQNVITVAHTFAATAESIVAAGYRPIFVDIDPATYLMDLHALDAALRPNTVAIVPVHLYGQMVDVEALVAWARRHHLAVIEDASQAHGASYRTHGPGQLTDAACFSFFPGKNLGAFGDAGAVVCNDEPMADRIAKLADHGRSEKHVHEVVGNNARMDALQAAVLDVKLAYLDLWNDARRSAAQRYRVLLSQAGFNKLPTVATDAYHVYHQFVVEVDDRNGMQQHLREQNIATGVHYPLPLHLQPAFQFLGLKKGALPVTESIVGKILSLPIFPHLSDQQARRVAGALALCRVTVSSAC